MTRLVISLTTIPPRFQYLQKNLESLLSQTAIVDQINLYIPREYRRFNYDPRDIPKLPKGVNLHICKKDYGPATKILPSCEQFKGKDVIILFGDDDRVYDKNWAKRFVVAAKYRPGHVICEEGGNLDLPHYAYDGWISDKNPKPTTRKVDFKYRMARIMSMGRWTPSKTISSGYVDILEGWGGVLVRPEFFDEEAFEIPDILWSVDDVWLSGCLERLNIPIWLNAIDKVRPKGNSKAVKEAALSSYICDGHDRMSSNRLCIDYFRKTYGIWGGPNWMSLKPLNT